MACLQVCQRVCSTVSSLYFWPLCDSSLAYQAMHRSIRDMLSYPQRATFKLCLATSARSGTILPHHVLHTALHRRSPHLRSADQHKLFVPRMSTSTFGPRAFCSSGPLSWNTVPSQLRGPAISIIFRQSLKTYLLNNNSD